MKGRLLDDPPKGATSAEQHPARRLGARAWPLATLSSRIARPSAGILTFFLLAEGLTRFGPFRSQFVPYPSQVLAASVRLFGDPDFVRNVRVTLEAWGAGLALSIAIAVPLGILLGTYDPAYRVTRVLIELVRPVPAVAILPVAIMLWGQGLQMKTYIIAFAAVWPILFNTLYAVHDVDPLAKDTARAFGFSRLAVLRRVSLMSAAPFVATGIRVSASIALIVGIAAELLAGGPGGIGVWSLQLGAAPGNADRVFAGSVIAATLGYLINVLFERGERRLFVWHFAIQERR